MVNQFAISMEQAAAKRRNVTWHTYDSSHGNQVEFTTAGGEAYLWYPGNAVVLKGEWRAWRETRTAGQKRQSDTARDSPKH